MDIFIARVNFPNTKTNKDVKVAHQLFIAECTDVHTTFYPISSLVSHKSMLFEDDGYIKANFYVISGEEIKKCGLKAPSYIDCSTGFKVVGLDYDLLENLSNRRIDQNVVQEIYMKINEMKKIGKHSEYTISLSDMVIWNSKLNQNTD